MPARVVAPEVRSCETCGIQFEVGGRGRPPRRQRFCSQACNAQTRTIDRARVCPVCRKTFTPGARGAVGRSRRWCSNDCAGLARIHAATIPELTVAQAAYFAGLLDGEGSIFNEGKVSTTGRRGLRVIVTNTSEPMLDWLVTTIGGHLNSKKLYAEHHKPAWTWILFGQNAVSALQQSVPYLITKRDIALAAIASQPSLS
jgi:hypothetical protein